MLNTLDVVIGFMGVMLVLSLAGTALVQFVQSALQVRTKNLRVGLQALLEKLSAPQGTPGARIQPKEVLDTILKLAPFVAEKGSTSVNRLFSPATSWITLEELLEHLKTAQVKLSDEQLKKLELLFPRMEEYLRKRFILNVRMITMGCAVVIACYFQASTPHLLTRLSHDEKYRAQMVGMAEQEYKDAAGSITAATNRQNVAALALDKLAARSTTPPQIKQAASAAKTSKDPVGEFRKVVDTLPAATQAQLTAEYEKLQLDLLKEAENDARKRFESAVDRVAKFNLTPWEHGWSYYNSPANIIGVLITAVFLTFGAPFWYGRLQELIQLRDALKPKSADSNQPKPGDPNKTPGGKQPP